jgi:acetoin utilization protein AcuB
MLAEELIVQELPSLKPSDNGDMALRWMDEYKVTNLCVVNEGVFLGTISEDNVLNMSDVGEAIITVKETFNHSFVRKDQHVFEAVKVINEDHLTVVPVLDAKDNYLGCISISQMMKVIANLPMANHPGAILVLELSIHNYSLQAIAGIVEENNARILGTFIASSDDSSKLQLTLKLNKTDIGTIISSLQRHDYEIVYFENNESDQEDMLDRFDSLMNYLNV